MYMRMVRLKVRPGQFGALRGFYQERVIPALQRTEGCLFASLLQPIEARDEGVSMTLWSSREHAEAYESSGLYDRLLDESDPFLAASAEWRVRLAGNPHPDLPSLQEPDVELLPVEVAADRGRADGFSSPNMFVRIVAVRVQAGRFDQLRERYNRLVVPELLATPGCRSVFLVEGMKASSRALSVTLWDSESAARRYEASGTFDRLVSELDEFFSGLYQWRLSLAGGGGEARVTGSELDVSGYRAVTGYRLDG